MIQENISLLPGEEILPIIGYEGLYSITSFGRVYSHEKIVKNGKGSYRIVKAKFLKTRLHKEGYLTLFLCKDSEAKSYRIHRLVTQSFIKNPQSLLEVNHKDGNKYNNHKDNLEWCTHEDNMKHASENKLFKFKHHSELYGVSYHIGKKYKSKPWNARITVDKKLIYIGSYKTELEAAKAYNSFIIKHNLNKPLNFIEEELKRVV